MEFDFSAILVALTFLFGVVWAMDRLVFAKARQARAAAVGEPPCEPAVVDWARSLFPVVLAVLVLRSFVAEPFRIPSGSMMPTLDIGDFILVNKFAYGLRWPVLNTKFLQLGEPKRGDVVVFRFPGYLCSDGRGGWQRSGDESCNRPETPVPNQNWIKRVIALPGDRLAIEGDKLLINDRSVTAVEQGVFQGNPHNETDISMMEHGATVWQEDLFGVKHQIARMSTDAWVVPPSVPSAKVPAVVPKDCYLVMGDNRYDSLDSRWWGCVPERNLAGKAFLIWFSWTGSGIAFHRIGQLIH